MLNPFKSEMKGFHFKYTLQTQQGFCFLISHKINCPSKVHLYRTCFMVENSQHNTVGLRFLFIPSMLCSFTCLLYSKDLEQQHGAAECAL